MSLLYPQSRIVPAGDRAVTVEVGEGIAVEVNRRVRALGLTIRQAAAAGVDEVVPAYRSLLVYYDPARLSFADLEAHLRDMEGRLADAPADAPRVVELPTVYGGEYGPDIDFVAEHAGLSVQEVIDVHSGPDYLVYMMGFTPGFTYLGGLSERIVTPRLETPRTAIPAGSVGIAEAQTGVYPMTSPGGWRLIGRTPVPLFDPHREPPVLVEPGEYVRFVPIAAEDARGIEERVRAGTFQPTEHPVE